MNNTNDIKVMVNPYNFNNKPLDRRFVEGVLNQFEINDSINSMDLYQLAFIHNSYTHKKPEEIGENVIIANKPEGALELFDKDYERLEFLGDAVISIIVARYLYERYPDEDEGFLTKMRTKLVNGEMLAFLAGKLNFGEYAILSRHIEDKCNGRKSLHILEDMFEAFIGAMFLDFNEKDNYNLLDKYNSGIGFQICEKILVNIYETYVDFSELIVKNTNYKEQLNKYFKKTYNSSIIFSEPIVEGGLNDKIYTVNILDNKNNKIGVGIGKSKKKAEQYACKNTLENLGIIQ
jgi:ribonuclease-3